MSPISHERIDFIKDRLRVLDQMRRELTRRRDYYFQKLGASGDVQLAAVAAIRAEELTLYVEHDVLVAHFGEQAKANIAAMGVELPPVQA